MIVYYVLTTSSSHFSICPGETLSCLRVCMCVCVCAFIEVSVVYLCHLFSTLLVKSISLNLEVTNWLDQQDTSPRNSPVPTSLELQPTVPGF